MPKYQLHIVDAENGENIRQPIVEVPLKDLAISPGSPEEEARQMFKAAHEPLAFAHKLKDGEKIIAVTEINEDALKRDYPDGHPLEEKWVGK
jgi:hypothetical protein